MQLRSPVKKRIGVGLALAICAGLLLWCMTPRRPVIARGPSLESAAVQPSATSASVSNPASLSGTVRSPDAEPVAGARVCATDVSSEASAQPRPHCVQTDSKGRYRAALVAGGYHVSAEAAGFAPAAAREGKAIFVGAGHSEAGVDLVLSPGGAKFAGRVLDATGGPIAGAAIRVTRMERAPHHTISVETSQEGRFTVWVEPGSVTWMAEAIGYASARGYRVAPTRDLVIELTPASSVQGEVVAADDGTHVPGVEVRAVPLGITSAAIYPSVTSNTEGEFTLQGLEPGAYNVTAQGPGWWSQSAAPLKIGLAERVEHVVVTVSPVAQVFGRVLVGSSDQPCQQGTVALGPSIAGMPTPFDPPDSKLQPGDAKVPSLQANIEADGRVHFRAVPAGRYHAVVRCVDALLHEGPTTVDVERKDVGGLVWRVDAGARLVVHFVDETDRPVAGARGVILFPARRPGDQRTAMGLLADADGKTEYPGSLYPGTYTIRPDSGYDGDPVDVELRDGKDQVGATLRIRGRASILVSVQTPEKEPVDHVTVSAVRVAETATAAGPAAAGASTTPEASRATPAVAPSVASNEGPSALARSFNAVALGNGRFRVGPLTPGRFHLRVSDGVNPDPSGQPDGQLVELRTGVVETTITLQRGASIRGRVVDASNQPMPNVWVSADCRPREQSSPLDAILRHPPPGFVAAGRRVVSDPEGHFTLGGLALGVPCALRAEEPFGAIGLKTDARVGDDNVTIALPALGTIGGTAATTSGEPIERFTISVTESRTGGSRSEAISAPGGRWRLENVLPGSLQITADGAGALSSLQTDLAPGQSRSDLALTFRSPRELRAPSAPQARNP
jgi:protocatechuate 3,4-dioxygenase beta subunit